MYMYQASFELMPIIDIAGSALIRFDLVTHNFVNIASIAGMGIDPVRVYWT
jgi:hypothetical protein